MCSGFFGMRGKPTQKKLSAVKSPDPEAARTNKVFVAPNEFSDTVVYVKLNGKFPFTLSTSSKLKAGTIALSMFHRRFAQVSLGSQVSVEAFDPISSLKSPYIGTITIELSFLNKMMETSTSINGGDVVKLISTMFDAQIFSQGQSFNFDYQGMELCAQICQIEAVSLEGLGNPDLSADEEGKKPNFGILTSRSGIDLIHADGSKLQIEGSTSGHTRPKPLLKKGFRFEDLGIGGLDNEFKQLFRRAFSSRILPADMIQKLGIQHVKGLILYGPPGTGKTLMARQIGKMLNSVEPIVVNGPEILNKYVGESEQNIRKLFEAAETEYRKKGDSSQLHIIIFDEIDAVCKQRGTRNDGTGVGDSVVNQLLSKIDGVDQLNNVLIIGMTNRLDMLDEALLRPGRFEVHIEIGLPDTKGRYEILRVHTSTMRQNKLLEKDVDLDELSELTKNYSGAEISGLCKSAASFAFNRHIKLGTSVTLDKSYKNISVCRNDFMCALNEVKPSFGSSDEDLNSFIHSEGFIKFNTQVGKILREGEMFVKMVKNSKSSSLSSLLLYGSRGCGKSALVATIALNSGIPFIKVISPHHMLNMSEFARISHIVKVFNDAYKSEQSIVILDDIERLLEWVPIGPRFSNGVLQTLLVFLKKIPEKSHRLLILGTTSSKDVLEDMGMFSAFDSNSPVLSVNNTNELKVILEHMNLFSNEEIDLVTSTISEQELVMKRGLSIPIKQVIMISHIVMQIEKRKERVTEFVTRVLDSIS